MIIMLMMMITFLVSPLMMSDDAFKIEDHHNHDNGFNIKMYEVVCLF